MITGGYLNSGEEIVEPKSESVRSLNKPFFVSDIEELLKKAGLEFSVKYTHPFYVSVVGSAPESLRENVDNLIKDIEDRMPVAISLTWDIGYVEYEGD